MAPAAGDAPATGLALPVCVIAAIALGELQLGVVTSAVRQLFLINEMSHLARL